jgi:hypothetical protein
MAGVDGKTFLHPQPLWGFTKNKNDNKLQLLNIY